MKAIKRILALSMGIIMSASLLAGVALAAAPGESPDNPAYTAPVGYAHINHYVTPTEIPDVFKVTLEISSNEDPKPTDVVIVLDGSGSMLDPLGSGKRWDYAIEGAVKALDIFLDPGNNPGAKYTRAGVVSFGDKTEVFSTLDISPHDPTAAPNPLGGILTANSNGTGGMLAQQRLSTIKTSLLTNKAGWRSTNALANTSMLDGLTEAQNMFDEAGSALTTATGDPEIAGLEELGITSATYNADVRKFIIFLGDGGDHDEPFGSSGTPGDVNYVDPTLLKAIDLKDDAGNYDATIMTIGLGLEPEFMNSANLVGYGQLTTAGIKNWNKPYFGGKTATDGEAIYDDIFGPGLIVGDFGDFINKGFHKYPGDQFTTYPAMILSGVTPGVEPVQELIYMATDLTGNPTFTAGGPLGGNIDESIPALQEGMFEADANNGVLTFVTNLAPGWGPTSGSIQAVHSDPVNLVGRPIDFAPVYTAQELTDAFEQFARKIIEFGENAQMTYELNTEYFSIYENYPGMTSWYRTTGRKGQTATKNAAGDVRWDFHSIPLIGKNTVEFYVKFDSAKTDASMHYLTFKDAWLSYLDTTTFSTPQLVIPKNMVKYIPEALIQGGAGLASGAREIKLNKPETASTATSATRISVVGEIGAPVAPYTPSPPQKVADENVDEMTIEGGVGSNATNSSNFILLIVGVCALAAIGFVVLKRKNKND